MTKLEVTEFGAVSIRQRWKRCQTPEGLLSADHAGLVCSSSLQARVSIDVTHVVRPTFGPVLRQRESRRWRVIEIGCSGGLISTRGGPVILRIPLCGAGGNRTPVPQPVNELATTIPGIASNAETPTGRLQAQGLPRIVFPTCQRSFSPSAVFPAVIPHFCCRAVVEWPRATFLLTMTLHSSD